MTDNVLLPDKKHRRPRISTTYAHHILRWPKWDRGMVSIAEKECSIIKEGENSQRYSCQRILAAWILDCADCECSVQRGSQQHMALTPTLWQAPWQRSSLFQQPLERRHTGRHSFHPQSPNPTWSGRTWHSRCQITRKGIVSTKRFSWTWFHLESQPWESCRIWRTRRDPLSTFEWERRCIRSLCSSSTGKSVPFFCSRGSHN